LVDRRLYGWLSRTRSTSNNRRIIHQLIEQYRNLDIRKDASSSAAANQLIAKGCNPFHLMQLAVVAYR
jgi:hypothetical protein